MQLDSYVATSPKVAVLFVLMSELYSSHSKTQALFSNTEALRNIVPQAACTVAVGGCCMHLGGWWGRVGDLILQYTHYW